jgi:hypothetical protein
MKVAYDVVHPSRLGGSSRTVLQAAVLCSMHHGVDNGAHGHTGMALCHASYGVPNSSTLMLSCYEAQLTRMSLSHLWH